MDASWQLMHGKENVCCILWCGGGYTNDMRVGEVVWHNCLHRLLSCTAQCVVVETGHGTIMERLYYLGSRMTTNTNGAIRGGGGSTTNKV